MVYSEIVAQSLLGTTLGNIIGASVIATTLIVLVIYAYFALAWMSIAQKLDHKYPWLAWIPIANFAMILQLGKFHWAWIFLILIPLLGVIAIYVMLIIAHWRIFEARNYPPWLSLILVLAGIPFIGWIANLVYYAILGFVAWKDQ